MSDAHDIIEDLRTPTHALRRAIPQTWAAFGELHNAALIDGALSARVKELMALAISVVKRCDG